MTRVKISDCFYVINLLCFAMKLAAIVCKLDRFLENWQIVQCNLQIGWPIYQLADWPGQFANCPDWTEHMQGFNQQQKIAERHCSATQTPPYIKVIIYIYTGGMIQNMELHVNVASRQS